MPTPVSAGAPWPAGWRDHTGGGLAVPLPARWIVVDAEERGLQAVQMSLLGYKTAWATYLATAQSTEGWEESLKLWGYDPERAGADLAVLEVLSFSAGGPLRAEELCASTRTAIEAAGRRVLHETCPTSIGGLDAGRFTVGRRLGSLALREYVFFVVQGNREWVLTFSVDEAEWAEYDPTFARAAELVRVGAAVPSQGAGPTPAPVANLGGTWYTTANGLVDDGVRSMAVAPDGSVWLGSYTYHSEQLSTGGVSRFDGKAWTTYTTADGLVNDGVLGVAVAQDGALWFTTRGGVSHFDGKNWTSYKAADGLGDDFAGAVVVAPDGALWFGTSKGVSRLEGARWTTYSTADGLPKDQVMDVAITADGAVWACHLMKGLSRFAGGKWTTYTEAGGLPNNYCFSLVVAPDGALWVSTGAGLVRYDGQAWAVYSTADGLLSDRVNAITAAPDGAWWFGSEEGISRFDGQGWTHYDTVLERSGSVQLVNPLAAIVVAPDGALWFATKSRGVLRYRP